MMNSNGVTQLPVIDGYSSVGSVRESGLLTKLLANRDLMDAKISDVMDKSFPVVDVDTSLNEIRTKLQRHPAVLIEDFKRITGIITRSDVLEIEK